MRLLREQLLRAAIISDSPLQRHCLASALREYGCIEVVLNSPPDMRLVDKLEAGIADVLLIDLDEEVSGTSGFLDQVLERSSVPILVNDRTAAKPLGSSANRAWAKRLIKKLRELAGPTHAAEARYAAELITDPTQRPRTLAQQRLSEQRLWVLGASLGGPEAIKMFFGNLPGGLPVAFLLAQHIGAAFLNVLGDLLSKNASYEVVPACAGSPIASGKIVLVPVNRSFTLSQEGCVTLGTHPAPGVYHPSIDQVLTEVARCYESNASAIIFSGMGEDGAAGCRAISAAGGIVWAQSAASCLNSSMPDAARRAGVVSLSAEPSRLAQHLVDYERRMSLRRERGAKRLQVP
jgi:chemosensory pili system protein ChpB (putative protein-glutamate methylesterase)